MKSNTSPYEKELLKLQRDEWAFKRKHAEKDGSVLTKLLSDKVPVGLQSTLDNAFAKAFALVFEKGTAIIEHSYRRDELEKRFKISEFTARLRGDRKSLKVFSQRAAAGKNLNTTLSGAAGMGMGLLGIGIPDIALFTSLLLKTIYETALSYGFDYDSENERAFILRLIHTALCHGDDFDRADRLLDELISSGDFECGTKKNELINAASSALSKDLLYMKFLQGIPIVGIIGGAYDAVFMQRIGTYAELKYRKRFYLNMKKADA